MQYKCLSIAGFDGSGGAGIQADLKTFSALGCYGMTVLTALPIQNTCGVKGCYEIPPAAIYDQLEVIFDDIVPDTIKIGMLFSSEIINLVAKFLYERAQNIPIIVDPVMIAKSGDRLLQEDAVHALKSSIIPLATIITPNLPEARALIQEEDENKMLAKRLLDLRCGAVLLKGGHGTGITSDDIFVDQQDNLHALSSARIVSKNIHGTGCTLSAAIASFLARGLSVFESCKLAKKYLSKAIYMAKDQSVGKGHGPVNHFHNLWTHNKLEQ